MTTNFNVSQSKVNTYRLCTQKYDYKYNQNLKPKVKKRPLVFGTIVHEMIEADANKLDPFDKLDQIAKAQRKQFIQEKEQYGDIVTDAEYIMSAYFEYWRKDPLKYIKKKGKYSEHEIEVPLMDGITFKGKIDAYAESKGMKWLVEHKSHKNFPNDDHRWRNIQTCIYIPMTELMGWGKLDGTLWDYIRSKPPTRPQLLKSGELSSRELDSLPQVVIDTIRGHGLNLSHYKKLIDNQVSNLGTWFQRTYTPIKSNVIKEVMSDFKATAQEMADGKRKTTRTFGRHCDWCDFEPLCRARLQGNDEDYIKEKEYEQDTHGQEEPTEE